MDRNYGLETHYRAGNGVHAAYLQHRKAFSSFWRRFSFAFNPLHFLILSMEEQTFESPKLKKLFTNSYMVKEEILRYYQKVAPEKIITVHNGVEWYELENLFQESIENKAQIQKNLGLDTEAFQFLFVGNEYQRKGLELLLQALALIKEEKFQLSVVGKERNEAHFVKLAKRLGLEKKVLFFGPQKSCVRFYQAADVCVIPSYYDPFANVTVEALAMGLFVISSAKNGGSEVLINDKLGLVFSDFKPKVLAECLKSALLAPKTKERTTFIRNAVKELDFSNQITKIVQETL